VCQLKDMQSKNVLAKLGQNDHTCKSEEDPQISQTNNIRLRYLRFVCKDRYDQQNQGNHEHGLRLGTVAHRRT